MGEDIDDREEGTPEAPPTPIMDRIVQFGSAVREGLQERFKGSPEDEELIHAQAFLARRKKAEEDYAATHGPLIH